LIGYFNLSRSPAPACGTPGFECRTHAERSEAAEAGSRVAEGELVTKSRRGYKYEKPAMIDIAGFHCYGRFFKENSIS
jgi:hypothetical protein